MLVGHAGKAVAKRVEYQLGHACPRKLLCRVEITHQGTRLAFGGDEDTVVHVADDSWLLADSRRLRVELVSFGRKGPDGVRLIYLVNSINHPLAQTVARPRRFANG